MEKEASAPPSPLKGGRPPAAYNRKHISTLRCHVRWCLCSHNLKIINVSNMEVGKLPKSKKMELLRKIPRTLEKRRQAQLLVLQKCKIWVSY
ncbi:death-associated protein-like 1 isoform X6 [Chelonia mydas]|uniref:death-associated protein-like 1 isoform X6 n=1 Tax=Chelonia mydas TaxID=8469 RepID=UPI0018A1CCE4|nr:death-associated protein-like 1 isoform X6 [Chelonia mydas]